VSVVSGRLAVAVDELATLREAEEKKSCRESDHLVVDKRSASLRIDSVASEVLLHRRWRCVERDEKLDGE
jgi:hypothetical protein